MILKSKYITFIKFCTLINFHVNPTCLSSKFRAKIVNKNEYPENPSFINESA
jgi:hypothetical protein